MKINLVAIVGQTAVGKSSLAMGLAKRLSVEIIAADSRTVYKSLDIGTAKPSLADQKAVAHHLLDLVYPNQPFNVADFARQAQEKIKEIQQRQRLPLLVGGSGLYVDSILCNYKFGSAADLDLRATLEKLSVEHLQAKIKSANLKLPENKQNKRYLIRVLERGSHFNQPCSWRKHSLVVGLWAEQNILRQRIQDRLKEMLKAGLLDEAKKALDTYAADSEALKSNIYRALQPYFAGKIDLQTACANFIKRDLALAKKQITWFKRHSQIVWFNQANQALEYIYQKVKT